MRGMILALALAAPGLAAADPFQALAGAWQGSGTVRETPAAPLEQVRCRVTNTYDAARGHLTVKGLCVLAGRRLDIAGTLNTADDSNAVTGRWTNPDGPGDVPVSGHAGDDFIAFTYRADDPATGRALDQNVELRVSQDSFRLRSVDRADRSISMSDISFGR